MLSRDTQVKLKFFFKVKTMGSCLSNRETNKSHLKSQYTYRDLPKIADGTNTAEMADSMQEVIPHVVCFECYI